MSVNRFLYATNFVVTAPANRPAGPLVKVSGLTNADIFSITVSGVDARDKLNLTGDLLASGHTLDANYSNLLSLSGPVLNLTSANATFLLDTATVSGHSLSATGTNLSGNYTGMVSLTGPTMNLTSANATFLLDTATVSGHSLFATGTNLSGNYTGMVSLSGPTMNLTSASANFNLTAANITGTTLNSDYDNVNFKSAGNQIVNINQKGMTIDGMLVVKGDMVTYSTNEVLLGDSHIGLNAQHKLANEMGGGMTVVNKALSSMQVTSIVTAVDKSNVVFTVAGFRDAAPFEIPYNAIMQVSEASRDNVNGYYALDSITGNGVTKVGDGAAAVYTIDNVLAVGALTFVFREPPNEVFLRQMEANLTGESIWLSHVQMTDLRLDATGELTKAYGNKADFIYYPMGGGAGGSYENIKNGVIGSIEHTITKAITVCENSEGVVNLKLPAITQSLKGSQYKIINKQTSPMVITVNTQGDHINGYIDNNAPSYVNVMPSSEDRSISFVATITDVGVSPVVKGWQML
jgi:hypothetical protein